MNSIRLFWWNEIKLHNKTKENYGDLIGKYLVEKISNKKVIWVHPKKFSLYNLFKPIYITVGSILAHINKYCVVWGAGIISKEHTVKKGTFLAVRGPQTRNYLIELGYVVPEIFGDPALLLPKYFNPKIEKSYELGIIPHYVDKELVEAFKFDTKEVKIIDLMTNDVESTTEEILQCKKIISSSLHGVIVAHSYGIPAVWQKFSESVFGDDIKYQDYFESVVIKPYQSRVKSDLKELKDLEILFEMFPSLPSRNKIIEIQNKLLEVCPFK